jgi:hypothetical protein
VRWSVRFFGVDLGSVELLPVRDSIAGCSAIETIATVHIAEPEVSAAL